MLLPSAVLSVEPVRHCQLSPAKQPFHVVPRVEYIWHLASNFQVLTWEVFSTAC